MATVYTMTSLDLDKKGKQALFNTIEKSLAGTFRKYDLTMDWIPSEYAIGEARDQILTFICVPPYMEDERRKIVVRDIHAGIEKAFGPQKPGKVLVRFQHHPDDCCGDYGELRCDVKARAAKEGGGK